MRTVDVCLLYAYSTTNVGDSYITDSVATKILKKKYLVRVLLNFYKTVFSTSTLRGGFQKYLVRVLNTL